LRERWLRQNGLTENLRPTGTLQNQNQAEALRLEIKLRLSAVQSALAELVRLKKQLAAA
jgi:hypothetical protein